MKGGSLAWGGGSVGEDGGCGTYFMGAVAQGTHLHGGGGGGGLGGDGGGLGKGGEGGVIGGEGGTVHPTRVRQNKSARHSSGFRDTWLHGSSVKVKP